MEWRSRITVISFPWSETRIFFLIRLALSELNSDNRSSIDLGIFLRKEVIQPQVPLRLPCYDFTPITGRTLGTCLPFDKLRG
jgi:hypothetical protein